MLSIKDFPRTPPHVVERLYEQVALIHKVCEENNIPYFLIGGSLLGQTRGGSIIEWDDDCDVFCDENDMERLRTLLIPAALAVNMVVW